MFIKYALLMLIFLISLEAQAFEDVVIMSDGKLSDIKIEDSSVAEIYPLVTIMNEKNMLIVHPLKSGSTEFCVLKDGKNLSLFTVDINEETTSVISPAGYEVLTLDAPEFDENLEIDLPPTPEDQ